MHPISSHLLKLKEKQHARNTQHIFLIRYRPKQLSQVVFAETIKKKRSRNSNTIQISYVMLIYTHKIQHVSVSSKYCCTFHYLV